MMLACASCAWGQGDRLSETNAADRILVTEPEAIVERVLPGVDINASQTRYSWRIVHNGTRLRLLPFLSCGKTVTRHYRIRETRTLEEAQREIEALQLRLTAEQQSNLVELAAMNVWDRCVTNAPVVADEPEPIPR